MPKLTKIPQRKRLTENEKGFYSLVAPELMNFITKRGQEEYLSKLRSAVIDKLGQLEDFEEKLGNFGIPLSIPLKALFDGIYVVNEEGEIEWEPVAAIDQTMVILGFLGTVENGVRKGTYGYGYEDYGISWALTKEELE